MKNFSSKKKGNFHHSSRQRSVIIIGVVVVALVVIFVLRTVLGSMFAYAVSPLLNMRVWIAESTGTIPMYLRDRDALIGEIRLLNDERTTFKDAVERAAVLTKENEELRALLGRPDTAESRIAAGVMTRPPFIPYDTLLIDAGSRDGIHEGAVVYYRDDRAIGVVHRTFAGSALITPFSTPGIETTVYVVGPDIYTTAYGEGDGVVRVSVPQGVEIKEGDVVLMPSLNRGIIGTINSIQSIEAEPEQHAYIVLTDSLQSLHSVAVATEPQQSVSFEEAQQFVAEQKEALFIVPIPEEILIEESTTPEDLSAEATTSASSLEP